MFLRLSKLLILLLLIPLFANIAWAQIDDCKCVYKVDSVKGDMYFVLKNETETPCTFLILSRSKEASPYLEKLQSEKNYQIIGRFHTFEGARFMALGYCTKCE